MATLEAELLEAEQRLKEKNQANNLVDFKLRELARNADPNGIGLLKVQQEILNPEAGQVLNVVVDRSRDNVSHSGDYQMAPSSRGGLLRPISKYSR